MPSPLQGNGYVNRNKAMKRDRRKLTFNLVGAALLVVWLVMVGILVKKVHFREHPGTSGTSQFNEAALQPIESAQREWKEIYLKGKKVGYVVNLIKPFDQGYLIQEEIFLRLNLMGMGSGVYVMTQSRVDAQFLLKSFEFGMTSGVVKYRVQGVVDSSGTLVITTGSGKEKRSQRIKLERPPMMGTGVSYYFRNRKLKVGEIFHMPLFDPSAMSQREIAIKVAARESVTINRISYDTFRLEGEFWGKTMTFWVDQFGNTIKEEGFMGLTAIKSSAARAPRDLETGGDLDFYEMTSVGVSRRLPQTERLRYLKLRMEGIDPGAPYAHNLNSGRQKYQDGILEIRKEKRPFKEPYRIPYVDPGDMKPFLREEFNIESDSEEIINKAREIVGKEKNPVFATMKIMDWVYENIEKKPVVSIPSALEVLRTRVGDCNEHATLLTALLRAAGIPARLSIGLVYTREKFFYHAWTEAYLGRWVTMDATTNQMPADVTHIKLIEGNLDKQVEIAGLIGRLKLKILDYE
ncbi:transglutaminase domain-containing protein [Thermodesulfobacteriota bacterium]